MEVFADRGAGLAFLHEFLHGGHVAEDVGLTVLDHFKVIGLGGSRCLRALAAHPTPSTTPTIANQIRFIPVSLWVEPAR